MQTYSVSDITYRISGLIKSDDVLRDVWIKGEVSNMRPASSGHWYFTLKDREAQIRCVMFKNDASRQIKIPQDGDELTVHGRVGVYEARGEYQLYADDIQFAGVGDLYQQYLALKEHLFELGLFDTEHKQSPPQFPMQIGVVTSPTTAAFQDVLNVLKRRYPIAEVILSPTLVQGNLAPPQIVGAIERLNRHSQVDVILLVRGGGSIEDLWCFNDERVAEAIFASRIPIVSGVGHEIDETIADFVADMRAPTPSVAAEIATPNQGDLLVAVRQYQMGIQNIMRERINRLTLSVETQARNLNYSSPLNFIHNRQQRIDELSARMTNQQTRNLEHTQERLSNKISALNVANPQAILERGYAIVTRSEDGQPIINEQDAPVGTGISIRLKDGELKARIENKDEHENYSRTLL